MKLFGVGAIILSFAAVPSFAFLPSPALNVARVNPLDRCRINGREHVSWRRCNGCINFSSSSSSLASFNDDGSTEYSRELRLREEAESPFRKVRFTVYLALIGGAATSLIVSVTRILAALNGVNVDLMQESITNSVVDLSGIVVLAFLYKRDLEAQESRLRRAQKGAELAKLMIRGSFGDTSGLGENTVIPLKSLR